MIVEIITIKNSHSLKQRRLFRVKQEICEIRKTILNCTFGEKLVYYNEVQLYSIYVNVEINLTNPLTYMHYITNEYACLIPPKNRNSTNNPTDLCLRMFYKHKIIANWHFCLFHINSSQQPTLSSHNDFFCIITKSNRQNRKINRKLFISKIKSNIKNQ